MISVITAIYNQLAINKVFYESLCRCTDNEFELIVIDNGSSDGSREFFSSLGKNVRVICNDGNYSYPHCQNQGIEIAKGEILAFLNNDILLSPHWDSRILQILGKDGHEVLTMSSNDRMLTPSETHRRGRRWKHVKYPCIKLLGVSDKTLRLMTRLTYGNWDKYCEKVFLRDKFRMRLGFAGSAVIMTRKAIDLIGVWDPSQQGADFDLFMRTMQRHEEHGDMQPMKVVGGVVHHHFSRMTLRSEYPPFKDNKNLIPLESKWPEELREKWLPLLKE